MSLKDRAQSSIGLTGEARDLLVQLKGLCERPQWTEPERLSAYRLLHSLKSWAAMRHLPEMESLCHRLETVVRGAGALSKSNLDKIRAGLPKLKQSLLRPTAKGMPTIQLNQRVRMLMPQPLKVDEKELTLIRELQAHGRQLVLARIWISPDESMPKTRILLLQNILEDHALIHAEAWLWKDDQIIGPQDTRRWAHEALTGQFNQDNTLRGGLYRCLLALNPAVPDALARLWIDQVEAIHLSDFGNCFELERSLNGGIIKLAPISIQDALFQRLFLQQRQFMPGPRGSSLNSYLSYETTWIDQTALIQEIPGLDAGDYLGRIISQASQLPLAKQEGNEPQWRVLVEPIRLNEIILRAIADILVQLIRNSLAHGRDTEANRQKNHKPLAMSICLALVQEDESLVLEYSDDGSGIDPDRVLGRAGRFPGEPMSDADLLEIISTPEFTTEDQAKINAGRGMGLNMVDHTVRQILRGKLELQNRPNRGCSFTIRIPRRLFPLNVLLFEGNNENFALPSLHFATSVALNALSVDHIQDTQWYFRYAGQSIKFLKCDNFSSPNSLEGLTGIVLIRDNTICGLVPVKRLIGQETVLMEVSSDGIFVRSAQQWMSLYTPE